MSSRKISMDITEENFENLETLKKEYRKSYGNIVNSMLRILRKESDIKEELIFFAQNRLRALHKELRTSENFETRKIFDKMQEYVELLAFLENDDSLTLGAILSDLSGSESQLKRIKIMNGILTYPEDFMLLNENEAEISPFVIIIEVANARFSVPHFVYFSPISTRELTPDNLSYINQLCVEKWSYFQEIVDTAKKPIFDENYNCLNEAEMQIAPRIGYFDVKPKKASDFSKLCASPMGVQIVQKNKKK